MNKLQKEHEKLIKFELSLNPNQSLLHLHKCLRRRNKELFNQRETLVRHLAFLEHDKYLRTKKIDNKVYVEVINNE